MKFKGWIPTVGGRLSFELVGHTSHPVRTHPPINVADREHRYIICYQQRKLGDALFPRVLEYLRIKRSTFWFACFASCNNSAGRNDAKLTGCITIFPSNDGWKKTKTEIDQARENFRRILKKGEDGRRLLKEKTELAQSLAAFSVKFELDRDGDCLIEALSNQGGSAQTASPNFDADNEEHMIHIVCSQAFFFLKDITHTHQHHDPKTDTMTDIHAIEDNDDLTWRSETLRNLYRRILDFKRIRSEKVYSSAHGILCYAKAFKRTSERKLEQGHQLSPNLFDDLLAESIDASQRSSENSNQLSLRRSELIRTLAISILTITLSMVSILRLTDHPKIKVGNTHWVFEWLVKHIAAYPFIFVGLIVLFVIIILNFTKAIDVANNRFARKFYLFLQTFKNRVLAFIVGIIASMLVFDLSFRIATGNSLATLLWKAIP